jgi:DNA (cytosine-5)-methyltransferase 1
MAAYYNEIDPFAAAWLRELITAGLIADGDVDERSIVEVTADDVRGFTQCHFFAGIGGWSYALRLAGWDDARPVWTGSCPCQPFSSAGAQAGGHDPRDLWPVWFQLVKECRPGVVFGEQVEAALGHGWLDRLCDDLEAEDYAVGACGLPGPCVGAFDIRQRLWFVAESESLGYSGRVQTSSGTEGWRATESGVSAEIFVADTDGQRRTWERLLLRAEETGRNAGEVSQTTGSSAVSELANAEHRRGERRLVRSGYAGRTPDQFTRSGDVDQLGEPNCAGPQGHGRPIWIDDTSRREGTERHRAASSFWAHCDWLPCADGKARPVEPGTFPLAHGVSNRVGRLRGYGNAIKPQVAQVFIEAYMSLSTTPNSTPPCDAVPDRPTAHETSPRG